MSRIIKNVFLPEKIGTYYLFSKRVVGIDIGKTDIKATKTRIQAKQSTIELCVQEKIESGTTETYTQRASQAIKSIFTKIGKFDEVNTALPSSIIIFKELTLPFLTRDKISMVVNFEVEPLLPFPLSDAIIDFIITKQNKQEKSSSILVAAVQKQHIAQHLSIFESAGISPQVITIDMFSLYGLYKTIPSYAQLQGGTALIEIGPHTTAIALMINSQLKMIRTLSKGVSSLAKNAAQELKISPNEVMTDIIRFGIEKPDSTEYTQAVKKAATALWHDINFTLTSFSTQILKHEPITKIILLGEGSRVKDFYSFISQKTEIPFELFKTEILNESKTISIKKTITVPIENIVSIGISVPSPVTIDFNLRKNEFKIIKTGLLFKQLAVLILLTIGLFATLLTHYSIQVRKLRQEARLSEQEALNALKETFPALEEETKLDDAIEEAEKEVSKQKETWFAFSSYARASFLQYLLELTSKIDKKALGFQVNKIIIAEGILVLRAKVKDYEALKTLERELRKSTLFSYVEPQENPSFTMKIILAPSTEEL